MSIIYLISFIVIGNMLDVVDSEFLKPIGGMEMTWLLSFYWFIPVALLVNILTNLISNKHARLLTPLPIYFLFFILFNGGIHPIHNRMVLVVLTCLVATYSVITGRVIINKYRNKPT
ncbi:MAG: hypothetical protein RIC35_20710 [Marinoscillum sp.]